MKKSVMAVLAVLLFVLFGVSCDKKEKGKEDIYSYPVVKVEVKEKLSADVFYESSSLIRAIFFRDKFLEDFAKINGIKGNRLKKGFYYVPVGQAFFKETRSGFYSAIVINAEEGLTASGFYKENAIINKKISLDFFLEVFAELRGIENSEAEFKKLKPGAWIMPMPMVQFYNPETKEIKSVYEMDFVPAKGGLYKAVFKKAEMKTVATEERISLWWVIGATLATLLFFVAISLLVFLLLDCWLRHGKTIKKKEKIAFLILTALILFSFEPVFAGGSSGSGHHKEKGQKQEQEQEQKQNQSQTQNQTVNVNTATTAISNSSSSSSSSSSSGSSSSSSVGDVSPSQSVNIESPTGVPLINPSAPPEVQLYQLSATAVEKGVDITLFYNKACKPVNSKEFPLESREEKIKKIQMVFTPHQDYLKMEKNGKAEEVKEVRTESPEEVKVKCLGVLNVESVAKNNIPLSRIYSEAGNYILLNLKGFERIYLVDAKDAIAAARGANNSGFGASFAPGQSWLFGSATGAIGAGLSYGSGNASNTVRLGTTFIILGESLDGTVFKLPEQPKELEKQIEKPAEKPVIEEKRVTVEIEIKQPEQRPALEKPEKPAEAKEEIKEKKPKGRFFIPDWE